MSVLSKIESERSKSRKKQVAAKRKRKLSSAERARARPESSPHLEVEADGIKLVQPHIPRPVLRGTWWWLRGIWRRYKKESCEHHFRGDVRCQRPFGHEGTHSFYRKVGPAEFQAIQWNDHKQPALPDGPSRSYDFDPRASTHDERSRLLLKAIADANAALDEGAVFELRGRIPTDYGHLGGVAWVHQPKQPAGFEQYDLPDSPLFLLDVDAGLVNELGGYILVGRLSAATGADHD